MSSLKELLLTITVSLPHPTPTLLLFTVRAHTHTRTIRIFSHKLSCHSVTLELNNCTNLSNIIDIMNSLTRTLIHTHT